MLITSYYIFMIDKPQLNKIEQLVKEFFENMEITAEIEVGSPQQKSIPINLKVDNPQVLIGKEGRTLAKIQHILKRMARDKIEDQFYIDLDINDYKQKKISYLKQKAREVGDQVALTKQEHQLTAMPSYERRIIHMELADRNDVTTQSVGKEPQRKVVIKPYS